MLFKLTGKYTFCVDVNLFPYDRASADNNGGYIVTHGVVRVNTSPAGVHASPSFWAFHVTHVKWESIETTEITMMIEFEVIVYTLFPFNCLFFIFHSSLVRVLGKISKYKIFVKVFDVFLH